MGYKIERSVQAACEAVKVDVAVGHQVRAEIEFRMRKERPLFIHIEQLQDLVEETLMDINQARVALAYSKFRARRAALREAEMSDLNSGFLDASKTNPSA
jgi:ribonucleoside-diphosphate reductase alpha chain